MLIDTVHRFIAEELKPLEDEVEETGFLDKAQAFHDNAKALNQYGMSMPAELGCGGPSNLDRILCEEQFGHTSDLLIRRAFGNVYEPLMHGKGARHTQGTVSCWMTAAVFGRRPRHHAKASAACSASMPTPSAKCGTPAC